ncbi:SpoIIIAC/SpoIIIAD family protein [Inediibacterium massiliense]|uniref:SpoIIIAC/SpoIIIAD family protein n=1 Tax=Inediibacterium massiliense TaxID=1658111 RepID=UPI0006B60F3A|nr:SpoIIIAC/SpoIIIAD family protein [Inediibacterium massiliense]
MKTVESILTPNMISILTLLATILIPIFIYFMESKSKILKYKVISITNILNEQDELTDQIKILFNGQEIESPHLIEIHFYNSGNIPIKADDFYKNILIKLDENVSVLTKSTEGIAPKDLKVDLLVNQNNIEILPTLLNSKDSFKIKFMTNKLSENIDVSGRILGVKSINEEKNKNTNKLYSGSIFLILLSLTLIWIQPQIRSLDPTTINLKLIFKVIAISTLMTMLNSILKQSGREEQAMIPMLVGITSVLIIVIQIFSNFLAL